MTARPALNSHPEEVQIDHRRYRADRTGDIATLLNGSGTVMIKNRSRFRRRLSFYISSNGETYDQFALSMSGRTTMLLPVEHPDLYPIVIRIYYPGWMWGLRICILARMSWNE